MDNLEQLEEDYSPVPVNPVWYWYRWNADHGARESVLLAMEKDAERYDELKERRYRYAPAKGPRL